MTMRAFFLAALAAAACVPAAAQDGESPGAAAPQAPASPPAPAEQAPDARRVVEVQLRQPPRAGQRQQSRLEREQALARYLETIGKPVARQPTARGPR